MDYLVTEGYPQAAQDFAREANIQPSGDVNNLQARKEIKLAIYSGKIKEAIEMINQADPLVRVSNYKISNFATINLVSCTTHILASVDEKKTSFSLQHEHLTFPQFLAIFALTLF